MSGVCGEGGTQRAPLGARPEGRAARECALTSHARTKKKKSPRIPINAINAIEKMKWYHRIGASGARLRRPRAFDGRCAFPFPGPALGSPARGEARALSLGVKVPFETRSRQAPRVCGVCVHVVQYTVRVMEWLLDLTSFPVTTITVPVSILSYPIVIGALFS